MPARKSPRAACRRSPQARRAAPRPPRARADPARGPPAVAARARRAGTGPPPAARRRASPDAPSLGVALPDQARGEDQREQPEEPGDHALRDRAEVADRPAAAVVRRARVLHVLDERVELLLVQRRLAEL